MRLLSGCGKAGKSLISKTAFAFLFAMLINLPAGASEKLTELSISGYGNNELVLFPAHEVNEFNVTMDSPEVLKADLYDYELEAGSKIIPSPHPKVKFMRVSQVSKSPDVVRATLVFNEQLKATPKKVGKNIVLETAPLKKSAVKPEYTVANRASTSNSIKNNAGFVSEKLYSESDNKTILDQKISLNFEQEDLLTILNALAAKFDLRIFADAGVKGKMSVNAQDVTLRDVLKNLLLQRNFQYTLKGRDLTVISFNNDSSRMARELLFKDLSLKDALQTLSKMMNPRLLNTVMG